MSPSAKERIESMDEELRIPEKPESPEDESNECLVCREEPYSCYCDL